MITKRKLKSQVEELYNILKETEANNASLKKRIDELQITIGAKDFEINELKKQVIELKSEKTQEKLYSVETKIADNIDTTIENEPIITEVQETKATSINEPEIKEETAVKYITNESIEDEISKYAAKAISNISLRAAMLSNLLAESGSANSKDLLTLTLGRSEVFKQKVFEASKQGANLDTAKATINLLEAETLEYFEQLKAQL